MSEEQKNGSKPAKEEKHYTDDIFIEHKFCRSCVNFARPSLPILSSWGKCQKGVIKGWCRDFFPACELYEERTKEQRLFEKIVFIGVIILLVFVLIKAVMIFSFLFTHPDMKVPPEEQQHWHGMFGQFF
jgi:hypothetical protein